MKKKLIYQNLLIILISMTVFKIHKKNEWKICYKRLDEVLDTHGG